MEGWIKIDRKILEWGWYTDKNTFKLFLHMLLKANWKDGVFLGVPIKKGSFATSLTTLVAETGLTESEVRTAIKHLLQTGEVTSERHPKFTVFTVKNYCQYQDINIDLSGKSQAIDRGLSEESQRFDRALSTIEERKKYKKEKKEERKNTPLYPPNEFFEDDRLDKAFAEYVDFRKRMKAPANLSDIERLKRRLCELSITESGVDIDKALAIINQSIVNGWKGLFPLDRDKKKQQGIDWEELKKEVENDNGWSG